MFKCNFPAALNLSRMGAAEETAKLRSMRGRIGAYESWARTPDRAARTWPARKAALDRFEREVDPDGLLRPQERAKRAEWARRAYICSGWR